MIIVNDKLPTPALLPKPHHHPSRSHVLWVEEPITSGEVWGFYPLPLPPATQFLVPRCPSGLTSRVISPEWWEELRLTVTLGALSGRAGFGLTRAALCARRGWEPECAQLRGCRRRWGRGRGFSLARPGRRATRPLQPVLQLPATGGGEQTSTCCLSRHHLSTLSTTRKFGRHPRAESSACRKFGESSATSTAGRPGLPQGERGGQSAAWSWEPVPAFSWSDAVPRSLIPMHRLILVYTLACSNFCSYRDTSATPQSASIKALRNANLRRDGKRLRFYFF